ncbi:unnamed protein product [Linum tenue]|uniref:Transcription repressor n=2 Tax=Linum tenue TaxID=586396 RepID=A0AAV0QGD7_9ROSI|nr:unnamed protein product [Linum tenue]
MSSAAGKPTVHHNSKVKQGNPNPNTATTTKKKKKQQLLLGVFRSSSTSNSFCGCGLSDVHDPASSSKFTVSRTTTVPPSPSSSINILAFLPKHPNSPAAAADEDRDPSRADYSSSATSTTTATTTTATSSTCSSSSSSYESSSAADRGRSAIGSSIAVVKDSDDPYEDFRDSMMQMVVEKGIYSRSGLEELLKRFLELNSPCYHTVIVRAFTQIWNEVVVAAADVVGRQQHGTCGGR